MSTGFIKKLDPPHTFSFVTNPRAVLGRPIPFSTLPAPSGVANPILSSLLSNRKFSVKSVPNCTLWLDMSEPSNLFDNSTKIKDKSDMQYTIVHSSGSFRTVEKYGFTLLDASVTTLDYSEGYVQVHNFTLRPKFTAVFVVWGNKDEFWFLSHSDGSSFGITAYIQTQAWDMMRVPGTGGLILRDKVFTQFEIGNYAPKNDTLFILIIGYDVGRSMNPYRLNGSIRESEESPDSNGQLPLNNNPMTNLLSITGWGPNGYLAEFIWYDRSISNQECEKLEGYLAEKWKIQSELPESHPYKNSSLFL